MRRRFIKLTLRVREPAGIVDALERARAFGFDAGWAAQQAGDQLGIERDPAFVAGYLAAEGASHARHFAINRVA